MPALVFAITERHRAHQNQVAEVSDFTRVEEGTRDVQQVLADPACTLYCLDAAQRQAIFVETPPHLDLYAAPFLYQAQFQNAQRMIAVSYEDLFRSETESGELAAGLSFLYSVGRCGSTLLGRALHSLPDVHCVAEPDALVHCIGASPEEAPALTKACVRLLCRNGSPRRASHYVIKPRHLGIKLAGTLQRVFPASRALFVYRNASEVVLSSLRAFHPLPLTIPAYHQDPIRFMTRQWLSVMQHYLALQRSGVTVRAVRYEDLNRDPQGLFAAICGFYGLAVPDAALLRTVFAADAQAGSNLSRENLGPKSIRELGSSAEIEQKVCDLLASHAELNRPDVVVPGTLGCDR